MNTRFMTRTVVIEVVNKLATALEFFQYRFSEALQYDEAAFCLIQRPYISKTLLTSISPRDHHNKC
jgi:hypothetical protein